MISNKCCLCLGSFEKGKGKQLKYTGQSCRKERTTLELFSQELGLSLMLPTGGTICYSCLSLVRAFDRLTNAIAGVKEILKLKALLMQSPQPHLKKRMLSESVGEDNSIQRSGAIGNVIESHNTHIVEGRILPGDNSTLNTNVMGGQTQQETNRSEDPIDVTVSV